MSDVHAAGVRLRPAESVAIVRELCGQIVAGALRGVPSMHVVRLSPDGRVAAEGPVEAHAATVARAARLLEELLPPVGDGVDDRERERAPGALRLAILRARGRIDLPPFAGFEAFSAAVARFAPEDPAAAVREVYARWMAAAEPQRETRSVPATVLPVAAAKRPAPLTISDVRRARRATGLTLAEVADRSRVPAALLRELEWGYLWNWPAGRYGRAQLVRYARAAGLDERLVLDIASPLLDAAVEARGGEIVEALPAERRIEVLLPDPPSLPVVVNVDAADVPILHVVGGADFEASRSGKRRSRAALPLAAAAAAALAVAPAMYWYQGSAAPPAVPADPTGWRVDVPAPASPHVEPVAAPAVLSPAPAEGPRRHAAPERPAPVRAVEESDPSSPSFTHAGSATFFHEEVGRNAVARAATNPQGTVLKITRIVDDNAQNFHARPSPDGTRIAFDSDRDGVRAVYVADHDGQHVRRVSGEGFAALPSWSLDGHRLAFVRAEPENPRVWNLWMANLESGEITRLTSYESGRPWGASWFPDGHRLAYSHEDRLVVLDLDTRRKRRYRSPVRGKLVRTPAVSPDGGRIVFQVYRDGTWLLDLAHRSMRRILDDPTAEEYSWAPDGRRVAFHSTRAGGWGVWVMGQ